MVIRQYMMKMLFVFAILILIALELYLLESWRGGGMSRNKAVFGIGILCFTAGMYFGGILAEVKRPEFPTEEQETRRTWER